MSPALLLSALLVAAPATPAPSAPATPVVAVRGFNAVGSDALTAGLLTQRFAGGLARNGILVVSLAELLRDAPEDRRQGIRQCVENSEACREAMRASGVHAILYGTVSFIDYQWRFSATALDMRDGSTAASVSEVSQSQSGLEQRLDLISGRFGDQLAVNLSRPVRDQTLETVGRNVISVAPLALGLGALYLEYERVLTDHVSVTVAPGVENLYAGVVWSPLADPLDGVTPRLDVSVRFYPQGDAPQRCWLSLGANAEYATLPNTPRFGGSALVGCSLSMGRLLLGTVAVGASVDDTARWGLDGRFHLGVPF